MLRTHHKATAYTTQEMETRHRLGQRAASHCSCTFLYNPFVTTYLWWRASRLVLISAGRKCLAVSCFIRNSNAISGGRLASWLPSNRLTYQDGHCSNLECHDWFFVSFLSGINLFNNQRS
jgi:hypothetical protein